METNREKPKTTISPLAETGLCSSTELDSIFEPEYGHYLGDIIEGKYRYRLSRELAHGGFGKVFLAETLPSETGPGNDVPAEVAIKVFRVPKSLPVKKVVKRELSGILGFRHEHVPRVYDWSMEGSPYVVFEYFPKGSLQDLFLEDGRLSWQEGWRLLQNLLSALAAAHRACILHLDIKPANVLIDEKRGYMLSDFGISQGMLVSHDIVPTGLGAPLFSAPEQLRSGPKSVDTRADLWGVGITCWCAVAGVTPVSLMKAREKGAGAFGLPALRTLRADCPPELDHVIMALLRVDPDERPGSAAEVLAYTEAVLSGEPGAGTRALLYNPSATPQPAQVAEILESLVDPLWYSICADPKVQKLIVKYNDGELLCREGDSSYHAFVLLKGAVTVTKDGKLLSVQDREGTFLGEITALTGGHRTARMEAAGDVWVLVLNAAKLEQFIHQHPAAAMRLIKSLAERCSYAMGH